MGLLRQPSERVKAVLGEGLDDPRADVRACSVLQLARLFSDEGRSEAERLATDPDASVRAAALWALHQTAGQDPGPFLAALADEDDDVLDAARTAVASRSVDPEVRKLVSEEPELCRVTVVSPKPKARPAGETPPGDPNVRERAALESRLRSLWSAPPEERRSTLLAGIRERGGDHRNLALAVAVLLDVDGLEEEILPLLSGGMTEPQWRAFLYLWSRRTDALVEQVREIARDRNPGAPCRLWIEWEGRPAVEGTLADLRAGKAGRWERLATLVASSLRPEDAEALLAVEANLPVSHRPMLLRCLARTGSEDGRRALQRACVEWDQEDVQRCALSLLVAEPSCRDVVLRICAVLGPLDEVIQALSQSPARDATGLLLSWLDEEQSRGRGIRCALARGDPDAAKRGSASRSDSIHARRRIDALDLSLRTGGRPPTATLEVLSLGGEVWVRSALAVLMEVGDPDSVACALRCLEDPDPWVQRWAWLALAACVARVPDDARYARCTPGQARAAWTEWLGQFRETSKGESLTMALQAQGLPDTLDGRGRCAIEGPWPAKVALHYADLPSPPGAPLMDGMLDRILYALVRERLDAVK